MFDVITVAIIEARYHKGDKSASAAAGARGAKTLAPQLCESDIKKLGCDLKNLVQREFCGAPVVARSGVRITPKPRASERSQRSAPSESKSRSGKLRFRLNELPGSGV
jgi:hypothetical protein